MLVSMVVVVVMVVVGFIMEILLPERKRGQQQMGEGIVYNKEKNLSVKG